MAQPLISNFLQAPPMPIPEAPADCESTPPFLYGFVDLFCGIGGASQGATDAGLVVLLAVDACERLLALHARNHPHARHVCTELPAPCGVALPTNGEWHLHGSPPCTTLSKNRLNATEEERAHGLDLVTWYLEYALRSGATTWSMEQVSVPAVVEAVEWVMRLHPGQLDYCIVDCFRLGVPQHRKRLIAGTPRLIRKLRMRRTRPRVVKDVIPHPRGTHTRPNATGATARFTKAGALTRKAYRYTDDDLCRPLDQAAPTVTAKHGVHWATPGSNTRPLQMSPKELLLLQTFPADYKLSRSKPLSMRGVGNAVPPNLMRELLRPITTHGRTGSNNMDA